MKPNKHKKQKVQMQETEQQFEHTPDQPDDIILELPPQEIQILKSLERPKSPTIQQLFMEKMQIRDSGTTFNESQDVFHTPPIKIHLEMQDSPNEDEKEKLTNYISPTKRENLIKLQNHPF